MKMMLCSLIWRLCKRNPGSEAWDREARSLIRRNLTDYFTDLLPSDDDMDTGHFQVFSGFGDDFSLILCILIVYRLHRQLGST